MGRSICSVASILAFGNHPKGWGWGWQQVFLWKSRERAGDLVVQYTYIHTVFNVSRFH